MGLTLIYGAFIGHIQVLGTTLMLHRNNDGHALNVLIFHMPPLSTAEFRSAWLPRRGT
jgi:hypothetical protein